MRNRFLVIIGVAAVAVALLLWSRTGKNANQKPSEPTKAALAVPKASTKSQPFDNASIAGRVRSADGDALPATVQIIPMGTHQATLDAHDAVITTNETGTFAFDALEAGRYSVSANAKGFLSESKTIELAAGQALQGLTLALKPGGSQLRGIVRDATGGLIVAAIVQLVPMRGIQTIRADSAATHSLADGQYEFSVAPGRYVAWAYHADYVPVSKTITISSETQELDFDLAPGAVVEGIVRHMSDETPVSGAQVTYATDRVNAFDFFANATGSGVVHSDAEGRFRIAGLGSGSLVLTARGENAATGEITRVALGIAEHRTDVALYVTDAFAIRGKVVDAKTKTGIPGIRVVANRDRDGVPAANASGADGSFLIDGLASGKYRLSASGENYLPSHFGTSIELEADVNDAVVELTKGAMVRGRVEPAMKAEISVVLDAAKGFSSSAMLRAQSLADGSFEIGPFSPSSFALKAESSDGMRGETQVELLATGLGDVVIHLEEVASLAGRVVNAEGQGVGNARVVAQLVSDGPAMNVIVNGLNLGASQAQTGPDGSFTILGLKSGTYEVGVNDAQGNVLKWSKPLSKSVATRPIEIALAKQEHKKGVVLKVEGQGASITGIVLDPQGTAAPDVWVAASLAHGGILGLRPPPSPSPPSSGPGEEEETETTMQFAMVVMGSDDDAEGGPGPVLGQGSELPPVLTDEQGKFEITGLREGDYNLRAEGFKGTARALVPDVATGKEITIKLENLTRIEGVVKAAGEPVNSFSITLTGVATQRKQVRDKEGRFTMVRIDPGTYTLTARSSEGQVDAQVIVKAGETTTLTLEMEQLTMVEGSIVDEAGKPISGVLVVTSPMKEHGEVSISIGDDTEPTGPDGKFAIGVRPGNYILFAIDPSAGPLLQKPIEVTGQNRLDLGALVGKPGG